MTLREKIRAAADRGQWRLALRLAATIARDLGDAGDEIKRAHEACWHPGFGQQLGRDPEQIIAAGIAALQTLENEMAKKLAPTDKTKKTKPTKTPKPVVAPEPIAPLVLTSDDLAGLKTIGGGRWEGSKDGARIVIARNPKDGSFAASIERGGIETSATMRGYASSARAAARELSDREAGR